MRRAEEARAGPGAAARPGPAGRAAAAVPPGLREQVLRLASSDTPDAAAHRASVAQRTAPFGHHGFPKPLDPPKSPWWRTRPGRPRPRPPRRRSWRRSRCSPWRWPPQARHHGGGAARPRPGLGSGNEHRGGGAGRRQRVARQRGVQQRAAAHGVRERRRARVSDPGGGRCAVGPAVAAARRRPEGRPPAHGSPGERPGPTTSAPAVQRERAAELARAVESPAASSRRPAPSTFRAEPGHPDVSPTTIVLGLNGGTLTLTAASGSVNWSIAESSGLVGHVTVVADVGHAGLRPERDGLGSAASNLVGGLRAAALHGRRGRVRGLHAHREPGRHHGHGRPRRRRQHQFQPAAVQPAPPDEASPPRLARPATGLSRCA